MNISRRFFTLLMTLALISPIDCHTASTREKNMTVDEERIRRLLERLGKALSAGDLKGVSTCWQIPALIFLDEAGTVVGDTSELEKLFTQASESYKKQGITSTKPELQRRKVCFRHGVGLGSRRPWIRSDNFPRLEGANSDIMPLVHQENIARV